MSRRDDDRYILPVVVESGIAGVVSARRRVNRRKREAKGRHERERERK